MIQIRPVTTSSTRSRSNAVAEVNGYNGDSSDADDENDTLLLKKSILRKSENTKQPSINLSGKNEKSLRFISKTQVNISFE